MIGLTSAIIEWVPLVTTLLMLPIVCHLDLKYREIPDIYMLVFFFVNIPFTFSGYLTGIYTWESLVVSFLPCILYLVMARRDYIHGDDFIFLTIISIICIQNPLHPNQGGMGVTMLLNFIAMMFWTLPINFIHNIYLGRRGTLYKMFTYTEKGIPMMLPIAAAFILTVVL